MILADTSVWIDHFRKPDAVFSKRLHDEKICTHPFIIGELACGNLKNRKEIIALLHALPSAGGAEDDEVLFFIDRHKLAGRGIGLIDVHLLAVCCIHSVKLWTKDKRLAAIAEELAIAAK